MIYGVADIESSTWYGLKIRSGCLMPLHLPFHKIKLQLNHMVIFLRLADGRAQHSAIALMGLLALHDNVRSIVMMTTGRGGRGDGDDERRKSRSVAGVGAGFVWCLFTPAGSTVVGDIGSALRRIVKRYKASWAAGLVHRLRGKHSNRRLDTALVAQAQQLIGTHYRDFGPTLAERHARVGELIQIDGSEHDWFEGRGPRCVLLVFIDDATSALMTLMFVPSESTQSYVQALRAYLLRHGLPMALKMGKLPSDRHSVFRNNNSDNSGTTQFARALERLGIEGIQARSPQAKGRVERPNQTQQDRLVKSLRLVGIDDMHATNAWIEQYRAAHNARFAVAPRELEDAHVAWRDTPVQMGRLLGHYEERKLSKTLSCQFHRQTLQIYFPDRQRRLAGQTVQLIVPLDGELIVMHDRQILPHSATEKAAKINPLAMLKRSHTATGLWTCERCTSLPLRAPINVMDNADALPTTQIFAHMPTAICRRE